MNAARLTRRWQEAAGDPARMVEALMDEINDPATGLVTRDFLRAELAQIREEIATLRGELRSEIAGVRGEIAAVRGEIAAVRAEIWRIVPTGVRSADCPGRDHGDDPRPGAPLSRAAGPGLRRRAGARTPLIIR
jgi:hypothetical protein